MMTRALAQVMLVVAVGSCHAAFAATALRHDPFARPLLPAVIPKSTGTAATALEEAPPWNPNLIAVMVAGARSLVNLDGTIVAIGQELDGYRLVQVRDHEAVFTKGKQRVVLKMETPMSRQNKERAAE